MNEDKGPAPWVGPGAAVEGLSTLEPQCQWEIDHDT